MGGMNIYIAYLFFGPPFYASFAPYNTHNITSSRRANEVLVVDHRLFQHWRGKWGHYFEAPSRDRRRYTIVTSLAYLLSSWRLDIGHAEQQASCVNHFLNSAHMNWRHILLQDLKLMHFCIAPRLGIWLPALCCADLWLISCKRQLLQHPCNNWLG